ncbi:MAG: ATP-binding protein [Clostridia bacterium]|nr:ATP-binding protein [Clostridia bacterium]
MDKISKGKNYEVIRNKILGHRKEIESHISKVLEENYEFTNIESEKKTYITIKVNGKDLFSYGSGFIQLTEIFSSIEYVDSEICILLIDEPDAHLHLKIQKNLIEELRSIESSQMFVISHNERFLDQVTEDEILYLNEDSIRNCVLKGLPCGAKKIALAGLQGCLEKIDSLRYARKLVFIEGSTDSKFFAIMGQKYNDYCSTVLPGVEFIEFGGVDEIMAKFLSYKEALSSVVSDNCEWFIVRDTDCIPIDKIEYVKKGYKDRIRSEFVNRFHVLFQNGYGIESTFFTDTKLLTRLIRNYYSIDETEDDYISNLIVDLISDFSRKAKDVTDPINQALSVALERQIATRRELVYKDLELKDMLINVDASNIQYIMMKTVVDDFLKKLFCSLYTMYDLNNQSELECDSLMDLYYSNIASSDDMYETHKQLLREIFS